MKRSLLAVAAAALLSACAAAPDEAWIRITRIMESGGLDGDSQQAVTVVHSDLRDSLTDTVDVEIGNFAVIVGSDGRGVGIGVYRARVEYRLGGFDFPDYEYPLTLYLPPVESTSTEGTTASEAAVSTGFIRGLPIAPATLKGWILNAGNFPPELLRQPVRLEAKVTIRARTDEGRELDTSATVSVEFTSNQDEGSTSSAPQDGGGGDDSSAT